MFSYRKEIQFEGEIHNCVLVAQNFLDCDAAEGMRVVGELMAARMRQFQHVIAAELPALIATMDLGPAVGDALHGHARHLQNWLSGILNWHQGCHRYTEPDLIRNTRPASASFGNLNGLAASSSPRDIPRHGQRPALRDVGAGGVAERPVRQPLCRRRVLLPRVHW